MSKSTWLLILGLCAVLGLAAIPQRHVLMMWLGGDAQNLTELSHNFMQDVQFKNFTSAANFHSPADRENANIPKLIEDKFLIKPELLDIRDIRISKVEVDRTGDRARTGITCHVRLLNTKEERDVELMLYWQKNPDGKWYLQLRSSL